MHKLDYLLDQYKNATPDICEHLDTLTQLAKECTHITEMGFRYGASACAMLKAQPKKLISYDLHIPDECRKMFDEVKGDTEVVLVQASTLEVVIEETDMLFIDTLHTYNQLKKELNMHGNKAKKYLVFHDTEAYGTKGEDGSDKGLMDAINEFIKDNNHWILYQHYINNNGLTVLKRI